MEHKKDLDKDYSTLTDSVQGLNAMMALLLEELADQKAEWHNRDLGDVKKEYYSRIVNKIIVLRKSTGMVSFASDLWKMLFACDDQEDQAFIEAV